MPTPFSHLALAEEVRASSRLPAEVRDTLRTSHPAYLLGHVAPDYVSLAGHPRQESHLFEVPMGDRRPAHQLLFDLHPDLADPRGLDPDHAAFLAGYIVHLWVDQAWIAYVFEPIFGPAVTRGTFEDRLLDHNLLRAAWDQEDWGRLPAGLDRVLDRAEPRQWLPFAGDSLLRRWRDNLASQLRPGGKPTTVEVFATRHGIDPSAFAARLSGREPAPQAAARMRPSRLGAFRRLARDRALALTGAYLEGRLPSSPELNTVFEQPHPDRFPEGVPQ